LSQHETRKSDRLPYFCGHTSAPMSYEDSEWMEPVAGAGRLIFGN
jgi:hypothetical protein